MLFKLRYTVIIVGCFFYTGTFLIGQNIISNGDFEQNTSGWDTYFGSGYAGTLIQSTISHSGSFSARINVTQVPSTPLVRNAQLKTTDFHIQAGHDYHLSMWLRADRNVDIELILIKNTTPWTWLVAKTISLNTSYQHVDLLETNAPFTTDDDVRLAIRCGNEVAKIYVDDVVLTDCTPPSGYSSLQTSVTGKGTIKIQDNSNTNECILACNDQYAVNTTVSLQPEAEPGYSFSGWSGACSGNGACNVTLDQAKFVGAHFSLTGSDNSILDYRNITNWTNVGYDGAIPHEGNIIDMTQPPYNCVGNGTFNNYQALLDVLNDVKTMSGFNIVYFPQGEYYIEGFKSFYIPSNTVLRGECPTNTTLKIKPTKETDSTYHSNHIFQMRKYNNVSSGYELLLGGFHKGSNQLTVTSGANYSTGDYIDLRQDNDTNKMSTNLVPNQLDANTFSNAYNKWGANSVGEVFIVKSVSSNSITIDRGLHFTYDPKLNPRIKKLNNIIENAGIENIKIKMTTSKECDNIKMENCYNCWVRNIESDYTTKSHIGVTRSYHAEITGNYLHHSYNYGGGAHGYGVAMNHRSSNCLVENNIFYTLRHAMVLSYSPNGNVFGYNYSEESWDPCGSQIPILGTCIGDQKADISLHGFYPLMNLFEGNVVEFIHNSDWWGPSGPGNTFFRNRALLEDFMIDDNSDYQNVIANEIVDGFDIHSSVDFTLKHSNNYNQGTIDNNTKINLLPNSLYKNNLIPNFCDGFPFPQIGPVSWLVNNSGSYPFNRSKNPAEFRYKNATNKVNCLTPCSLNSGLAENYNSCTNSISVNLNAQNNYSRLYGFGINTVPTSNIGAGDEPDFYIKLYKNGSLVQSTSSNPIETYPDAYIKISSIILDPNANYEVKLYDADPWPNPDDYLGNITFSGNSPNQTQSNYIGSELLQMFLNLNHYETLFSWNDGVTTNPRTFNQNGTYTVEITQSDGCIFYDTTNVSVIGPPQTTGIHTWIGVDTDWFSACNWDKNHVPSYVNDVYIPNNASNMPLISGSGFVTGFDMNDDGNINNLDETPGKAYCKTIEIEDGGQIEIQATSGAQLIIKD